MITPLVLSLISALILNINTNWWNNQLATLTIGLFYITTVVWLAANLITFSTRRLEQLVWGGLFILAGLSSILTIIFYVYKLNDFVFTTITFLIPILLFSLGSLVKTPAVQIKSKSQSWSLGILLTLTGIGLIYYLLLNQIDIAVRTPWQILSIAPLVLFGIVAVSFIMTSPSDRNLWRLIFLTFASWGLLLFVFPLPYGFDPWIHQASETLIAGTGTLRPKPLYYIGLYMPVAFLSKLLELPVNTIDRWLLPVVAAAGWSAAVVLFIKNIKPPVQHILLIAAGALAFGWSMFTVTTPQALANFWALVAILLLAGRLFNDKISWWPIWLVGLASLASHPLTGLPLILLIGMFWFYNQKSDWVRKLSWLAGVGALIVTPLAFVIFSWLKISAASVVIKNNLDLTLQNIGSKIWLGFPWPNQYIDILDWVYWWWSLLTWTWLFLAGWGLRIVWQQYPQFKLFLISFAILTVSFILMSSFLTFPNLPTNEQSFYTDRLWDLAKLWLWPAVLIGLASLLNNWWVKGAAIKNIILAGLTISLIAAFYLNYPRLDLYHKDTGYNTTQYDIQAVNLIANDAGNIPYVVLANQAVSAAALREFGFAHYYSGEFYYPLPTGTNPLYPIYLQATQTGVPTRAVVSQAHNFAGTPLVYLVLNEYWADFDELTAIAKTESSAQMEVNNGYIKIYRYDFDGR